jgi:hypothetical protein
MSSALVVPTHAQAPGPAATAATELTGTVVSTSNINFLVRGDDGQDRSFVVFTTTQMPQGQIVAGERVKISYRPIDAERFEALSVQREPAPQPTPASAAESTAAESSGSWVPAVAALGSLAFLILAGGLTLFVAGYLFSTRRHHRVH